MEDKDFDNWNELKKILNEKQNTPFANSREIWWCSIGVNIGTEEDGKNELFERPIIILRVLNKNTLRIAPLTSKEKSDKHNFTISYNNRTGSVILSQIKTISTKRLSRKMARLDKKQYEKLMDKIRNVI
jgi:mRNA-degrading endonuclease toxin of MazEF toxin-antitoxin module